MPLWSTAQAPVGSAGRGRGNGSNGQNLYDIKRLRELILNLAVRGRLVPQNPADESAHVLLEKIDNAEKNNEMKYDRAADFCSSR